MRLPDFTLHRPGDLAEACSRATSAPGENDPVDLLGGGTDLLCNYKWRIRVRPRVVSLSGLDELSRRDGRWIGAGTRLSQLIEDTDLQRRAPALVQAASMIATPLIRNSATLGGNLLLDTRCWHLNQAVEWRRAHGSCLKAEADQCRVQPDPGDVCVATYSGDLAPVLLTYGARLHFVHGDPHAADGLARRVVDLDNFYRPDGIRRFRSKRPDEILVGIELAEDAEEWTVDYQKLRLRAAFDFPEGGVAVGVKWQHGRVRDIRLATTAYASVPELHPRLVLEHRGSRLEAERIERIAAGLQAIVRPMKNTSMAPSYRKKMARVLAQRALEAVCAAQGSGSSS